MREGVGPAPRDLLGEQSRGARRLDDLRQAGGEAEGVRQPRLVVLDAELFEEEALAVHELTGHRLGPRHVGVGLHPHPAGGDEPAVRDRLLDPGVHLGPVLLDPGVLLGLRHGEDEVGVVVEERRHVRRRTGHLADRLAQRPQPRGVDVGMADCADAVCGGDGGRGEHTGEFVTCRLGCAVHVPQVDGVQGAADRAQDLPAARPVDGQLRHQLAEDFQVHDQVPHRLVEDGQPQFAEHVLGGFAGRRLLAHRRRLERHPAPVEVGVGGGLDPPVDLLAAGDR